MPAITRKRTNHFLLYAILMSFLQIGCIPDKKKQTQYAEERKPEPTEYVGSEQARVVMTYKRLASNSYPGEAYLQIHLNEPANVTCVDCDDKMPITFVDASKGADYHYYGSITFPLNKEKTYVCPVNIEIERLLSKRTEKIPYEFYFCPVAGDNLSLNCDQANAEPKCPFER